MKSTELRRPQASAAEPQIREVKRRGGTPATTPTPEDLYAIVSEKYPCALTPSDGVNPWVLEVIAV